MAEVTHPTGPSKPIEVTPVEPEKKTRKKKEPVVRIYEWIEPDGQLKPVLATSTPSIPPVPPTPPKPIEFSSTADAQKWCNNYLNKPEHNGKIYLVVPVRHRFTVKVEQQYKVTRE